MILKNKVITIQSLTLLKRKPVLNFASILLILLIVSCAKDNENADNNEFKDPRDDNVYQLVEIEGMTWMAENLRYKIDDQGWVYNNDLSLEPNYGRMYNWDILEDVCPTGWRLPTKDELERFSTAINSDDNLKANLVAGGLRQNEQDPSQYPGLTEFQLIDVSGFYWSGTESSQTNSSGEQFSSFFLYFDNTSKETSVEVINKEYAISVRCVLE